MPVELIHKQSDDLLKELTSERSVLLGNLDELSSKVEAKVRAWKVGAERSLEVDNPFSDDQANLKIWMNNQDVDRLLKNYISFCQKAKYHVDSSFWHKELLENKPNDTARSLLLLDWQKKLDKSVSEWYFETLSRMRKEFYKQISEWLNLLEELMYSLESLGLELGMYFDLADVELKSGSIEELKRWADYLKNDEGAKKVSELLGKVRQIESSTKIEKVLKSVAFKQPVVDINSKEEIVGVVQGKDIEHALPSELALLSDPETSVLFDLKYLESRLLSFEMQGITEIEQERSILVDESVEEDSKLGPMILCVDTSGSMHGAPEHIAKAMALYLSTVARKQDRNCYLINFSTSIVTFDLTGKKGLESLIKFLSSSFHGGTDVAPALHHATELMKNESYENADVLVISDFIMGELPKNVMKSIEEQRDKGNKFNSLVIGDCFMYQQSKTQFDLEWIYNPYTSGIEELVNFKQNLGLS
ncbi:TPA: VWA domain-containing protein [Vibrio parahaemolyticus]|uniref:VWA domain-containing protein n=1 Tax=Vibrio parahaemolyticus TaxID=670 RepID=UPI0010AAFDEE|nr:VWA domain-containing protein [Vibrio parahaemolyticus]ELI5412120.1 VWA domain-containing protein [Vibrio parahaemolyticus]MBE4319198.1 VWA domain-containing protein [Vibrio parahaemolyticus]MBE4337345.1 VWA domain-containing protein [Vibrio parahaemolyticus]THE60276.1 VWA domain-containing protein [Vibrio parahaemolyticus]HAS6906928.1 VWA domain-containing protein [Vibrio parahaemolyticus]